MFSKQQSAQCLYSSWYRILLTNIFFLHGSFQKYILFTFTLLRTYVYVIDGRAEQSESDNFYISAVFMPVKTQKEGAGLPLNLQLVCPCLYSVDLHTYPTNTCLYLQSLFFCIYYTSFIFLHFIKSYGSLTYPSLIFSRLCLRLEEVESREAPICHVTRWANNSGF